MAPATDTAEAITVDSTEVEPDTNEDPAVVDTPTTDDENTDEDQGDDDADTFPRSYVAKLRSENARYRERARSADAYAKRLHTELVRATGRLADPTDLPFDESHLDDDALAAAVANYSPESHIWRPADRPRRSARERRLLPAASILRRSCGSEQANLAKPAWQRQWQKPASG